jgi:cobalt-zinc-cadmium efflux system membrane fusion protein
VIVRDVVFTIAAAVLAAGCREAAGSSSGGPAASVSATAARDPAPADKAARIEIDPALLQDGRVRVSPVERRRLDGEVLLAGDAAPAEDGEAEVGALVSGRVATLDAAEGDRVKKGQILARIDAPDAGRATADLLQARGRAAMAARKLERQLSLEKQGATSQQALDEARAEDQAARAELAAARTRAATVGAGEPAEDAGAPARGLAVRVAVKAPIDGIVVRRDAVLGGPVTMERSLFRLVDPDRLVVRARLPETRASTVAAGAPASVRPRGGGAACEAAVISTFGVVDEATRTVPLKLRPARPCAWLLPGAWVDVSIRVATSAADAPAAVIVPAEAVVDVRGVPTVFVADGKPGTFVARAVRPGATVGASIAVDAGLAEGERVVTAGALLLKGEMLRSVLGGD